MNIKIVTEKITLGELREFAKGQYDDMVKAVVDVEQGSMALGGELHTDANEKLLEAGSRQKDVWGINLYPERAYAEQIEFISLINIRPAVGNRSMEVRDPQLREKITAVVRRLIS